MSTIQNSIGTSLQSQTGTGKYVGNTAPTVSSITITGNATANNFAAGTSPIVLIGGTSTLTNTSTQILICGGSGGTLVLPDATTLVVGWQYYIHNNCAGNVTIEMNGGTTLVVMPAGSYIDLTNLTIAIPAGTWAYSWTLPQNVSWGTAGLSSLSVLGNATSANFINGYTTTTTAAGTTTLTVSSTYQQFFTGSTTQTVVLPVTSTLTLGQGYYIANNSSGVVTVKSSGGNTIIAIAANTAIIVSCILLSGTSAASWSTPAIASNSITIAGDSGSISGSSLSIKAGHATNDAGASVLFSNSGSASVLKVTDANFSTYIGTYCGGSAPTGSYNVGLGYYALSTVQGGANVGIGSSALASLGTGNNNTALGINTGVNLLTGSNGLFLGYASGSLYTSSESNNICLLHNGVVGDGIAANTGVIRIGTSGVQTTCYIAGINNTVSSGFTTPVPVFVDSATGQLGYGSPSTISTVNGDLGSVNGTTVSITAGNSTNVSGHTVLFANSGTASVLKLSDTSFNTFLGALSGKSGVGGSGNTGVGTSSLAAITSGSNNTACGYLGLSALTTGAENTSCGEGAGDSLTGGNNNFFGGYLAGSTYTTLESNNICISHIGVIADSATIRIGTTGTQTKCYIAAAYSNYGTSNTFVGASCGNFSLTVGSAIQNVGLGQGSFSSITTASGNTACGYSNFISLTSGIGNLGLGSAVGNNYTTESNNILIGSGIGTVADSRVLRIQNSAGLLKAFIGGINNVSSSGFTTPQVIAIDSSTGQLGHGTGQLAIQGVVDGSSAASGIVGEVISSVISFASSVSLTDSVTSDVTSITLPAGSWTIWGNISATSSLATLSLLDVWSNTVSATAPDYSLLNTVSGTSATRSAISIPETTMSISSSTVVYLSAYASFSTGTATACGGIYAIRVR